MCCSFKKETILIEKEIPVTNNTVETLQQSSIEKESQDEKEEHIQAEQVPLEQQQQQVEIEEEEEATIDDHDSNV